MPDSLNWIFLLEVLISIYTLWQLATNWSGFWDSKVTLADRMLASRLAIFVLVPLGVLLHEVGHSLATWQVGGTVQTFRWYFFSGYIIPLGDFNLAEYWWIVFAGNLVSILLGLWAIPLIHRVHQRIVGEILYFFALIQLIISLIIYPLFSLITRSGDWIQIYNLKFQPYAPFTLIVHVILLYKLWQLYHSYQFIYWRLSRSSNTISIWNKLKTEQENRSNDLQPKLDLAYFLIKHQETHEAKKIASKIYRLDFDDRQIEVLKLVMTYSKKNYRKVIKPAQKLLNRELLFEDRLRLYRILCISCLNIKRSHPRQFLQRGGPPATDFLATGSQLCQTRIRNCPK